MQEHDIFSMWFAFPYVREAEDIVTTIEYEKSLSCIGTINIDIVCFHCGRRHYNLNMLLATELMVKYNTNILENNNYISLRYRARCPVTNAILFKYISYITGLPKILWLI